MRTVLPSAFRLSPNMAAPWLIGMGVFGLLCHSLWPAVPSLTAVAFIALGSTYATIGRLSRSASGRPLLALHLVVYAGLYLLFLGAVCDTAYRSPLGAIPATKLVDLATSAAVMAIVLRTCVGRLIGDDVGLNG